jgi:CheY-like chemotaxis protein
VLRLMAQRLGARMRRAERIADARRHLALYRPDLVLVDLGLPDGNGADLIRDLALRGPDAPVVLGLSGDPDGRMAALAAGAAGFVEKPVQGLAAFRDLVARHVGQRAAGGLAAADAVLPIPDPLALRDDLERAADLIRGAVGEADRSYLARFLAGVARSARDDALAEAARRACNDAAALDPLARLVAVRLKAAPAAFAPRV